MRVGFGRDKVARGVAEWRRVRAEWVRVLWGAAAACPVGFLVGWGVFRVSLWMLARAYGAGGGWGTSGMALSVVVVVGAWGVGYWAARMWWVDRVRVGVLTRSV